MCSLFYCFYFIVYLSMYSFQRAKVLFFYDNKNVRVHKIDIYQKNNIF